MAKTRVVSRWIMLGVASMIVMASASSRAAGSGDLTSDGRLTTTDTLILRQYLLGDTTPTLAQIAIGDVNGDSRVDIADLVLMTRYTTGNAITIDVTPETASWTLTGPAGFTTVNGTGDRVGTKAIMNAPAGNYTLHFNALSGYTAPGDQKKTLASGEVIAFGAEYMTANGPTVTLTLPGGVPLVLVKCPAGSYQMGRYSGEWHSWSSETPQHVVTFAKPFYIGKFEVTQGQWKAVTGYNPIEYFQPRDAGDNFPMYQVEWGEIVGKDGFLEKLNAQLASTGQNVSLRLPSEAEWEYACRAGTTTRFYFGDSLAVNDDDLDGPTGSVNFPGNRSDYMWYTCNNQYIGLKPVGSKLPNAWGIYDMAGNVAEWCQDWANPYYTGAPTDGSAWETGDWHTGANITKIVRGGWFNADATECRSAYRTCQYTIDSYHFLGFRLAMSQ